jgi:hypothetical protein
MGQAAGKGNLRFWLVSIACTALLVAGAVHSAAGVAEGPEGLLVPRSPLMGGLPAMQLPSPAMPMPTPSMPMPFPPRTMPAAPLPPSTMPARPQPSGGYVKFAYPSAVAAYGPDAYVADSSLGALFRIDLATQTIKRLASLPLMPGVVLRAGPDGTLYLIRPDRSEIQRLSRDGRVLASYADAANLQQPRDLVVEPTLGRIWITDASGEVFEFQPSGALFEPLARRDPGAAGGFGAFSLLAAGSRLVAAYDGRCRCLVKLDRDGIPGEHIGEGSLTSPGALAIDSHQRIWVVDRADRLLKVFWEGRLIAQLSPARLGLLDFTGLAIDQQRLYIADGPGGRIGIFDLLPPKAAP